MVPYICKMRVWALAMVLFCAHAVQGAPPNIVVFISDDHTLRDSSLYGAKDIKTPQMERVAAAGLTFDLAFAASPTCAPSRGALLTGLMPARNGAEPNHMEPHSYIKRLPAYFHELGYEVVAIGKVAHYDQTRHYGFDYVAHTKYHEDIAVSAALEWLRERKSDKPLCLFVGSNWPHVPWPKTGEGYEPDQAFVPSNHVDTAVTHEVRAFYYAAIQRMDTELGKVFDAATAKFGTNLFFLHFSDQGAQWPFGKWTLYEDGIHVPMVAVWPGHIAPGTHTKALVSLVDVLPTMVEIAGGKTPRDLDGKSFIEVLSGKTNAFRECIFATHSGDGNFNVYPCRAVHNQRWKYILNLHPDFKFTTHITINAEKKDGAYWPTWIQKGESDAPAHIKVERYQKRPAEELYDLQNDPWEQTNLAGEPENSNVLAALREKLKSWMKDQRDDGKVYGKPTL